MFGLAAGACATWGACLFVEVRSLLLVLCGVQAANSPETTDMLQREIFRSARDVAAEISGTTVVSKVQTRLFDEEVALVKHMGLHAVAALATTWNQSLDAVFQPVITELQKRGW